MMLKKIKQPEIIEAHIINELNDRRSQAEPIAQILPNPSDFYYQKREPAGPVEEESGGTVIIIEF